jgi:lipid-binding SYLF domain-containing protein
LLRDTFCGGKVKGIPPDVLERAKCVAVFPHRSKAGFVFGGENGQGVATCRTEHGWSAPAFFAITGGDWGLQIGVEGVDLVMIFQGDKGMQHLLAGKFQLGADASATAGPVGLHASANTDWKLDTEVLTYSRAKGAFAGLTLTGANLRRDDDSTEAMYGSVVSNRSILAGHVAISDTAVQFIRSVSKYFGGNIAQPYTTSPDHNYQVVRIFFATDRALGKRSDSLQSFAGTRSGSETLALGEAEISIPRDHKMGELEEPSLLRLEFRADPERHVVLLKSKVLTTSAFQTALRDKLKGDRKKSVLVFVHGYNVSFPEAAQRLGQMTYDLGFSGAPILYSWPSSGSLWGYAEDEASVEWSAPHFTEFLRSLHLDRDVKTIYVVGHSMGNRLRKSNIPITDS